MDGQSVPDGWCYYADRTRSECKIGVKYMQVGGIMVIGGQGQVHIDVLEHPNNYVAILTILLIIDLLFTYCSPSYSCSDLLLRKTLCYTTCNQPNLFLVW